jgi:hypothetical protein
MPSGSPTPTAATGSVRVATRLALLRADELAAATAYLDRARTSSGVESLFWASLGSAATAYAEALTAAPGFPTERALGTSPVEPAVLVPPGEVAAMQTLITQLHGVIYGYQLCIGRLDGTRRAEAELRLRHHRALGDRLADALVARSATVPAAAPAYVPPIRPTNAARATALVRRMEVGLQPWAGRWVAASADDPTRRVAVAALASGTRTAARWGSPLPVWPGWSD